MTEECRRLGFSKATDYNWKTGIQGWTYRRCGA